MSVFVKVIVLGPHCDGKKFTHIKVVRIKSSKDKIIPVQFDKVWYLLGWKDGEL
jgi:hypothetical protein